MNDFESFVKEQLARPEVAREYYRLAPFYRLANQLLLLRKKRGLNQQELAAKADTTQAVVSRLENASVKCSLETIVRLAEAMDAIVEVQLKPLEELSSDHGLVEDAKDNCNAESQEEQRKGAVFFGSKATQPCHKLIYWDVDPLTGQIKDPKEKKRIRTLGIA